MGAKYVELTGNIISNVANFAVNTTMAADIADDMLDKYVWGNEQFGEEGKVEVLFLALSIYGGFNSAVGAMQNASKIEQLMNDLDRQNERLEQMIKQLTSCSVKASEGDVKADFYVKPNGEAVPATGYRYMSSSNSTEALTTGQQYTTYIGFDKFDSAAEARDGFQIAAYWSDCKVRGEFDTLQVMDTIYVPTTLGNTTSIPEPFAISYPEYGRGGAQQFRVDKVVVFSNVTVIGD